MIKRTHLAGGMLAGAIMFNAEPNLVVSFSGIALSMIGSLVPDIDTPTSAYGKKVKWVSKLFKHRGFTHSAIFVVLNWVIIDYLVKYLATIGFDANFLFAYVWGIISHILLDLLNYQGILLMFPLSDKFTLPFIRIKTGGSGDMFVAILCIALSVLLFFNPNFNNNVIVPALTGAWNSLMELIKIKS